MLGQMSEKSPNPNVSLSWGEVYLRAGHVEEAHRRTQTLYKNWAQICIVFW
jgi:hypothetical protein